MSEALPFPTQPLPEESNEAFAERKRKWARDNSERIMQQKWIDYPYLPEDIENVKRISNERNSSGLYS